MRGLRIALILGAIVDLSGAIPLLFFPSWMSASLGVDVSR